MENQNSSHVATGPTITVWISPDLRNQWKSSEFLLVDNEKDAVWKIEESSGTLRLSMNHRSEIDLPSNNSNLQFLAQYIGAQPQTAGRKDAHLDHAILELANLAAPLFFNQSSSTDIKPFLEKIATTISLKNGLDSLFRLRWFQNHSPGILLVHQKGEAKAWQIGAGHEDSGITHTIDIEHFNQLLAAVKKTKTGQYSTQTPRWSWLPFSGAFLAEAFGFKNFNAILIATRQEFLPFAGDEVNHFHHFTGLLGLWLEDLIESEFSDLRLAEVMLLLERCPMPIVLKDPMDQSVFNNIAFQENDIASIRWMPLGQGFNLGIGPLEEWENTEIDVLHRHKISLLGDLFNTLGHELSNPLFGLGLAADLLITNTVDDDSAMMLNEIQKNIKRCQLIIQNLSKLYSNQEQDATCDVKVAIKEALTLAKSELRGIRHDTGTIFQDNSPLMVEGRPVLVVQILFNLIVNSAQAMSNGTVSPKIGLNLHVEGQQVLVDIFDNGPGLPPSVRETLFRPFATTKAKGHGLGLALSRNLAVKAGGNLEALNPTVGASFRLTLRKSS